MKTPIESCLKALFESVHPQLDFLLLKIECPFDSGISVECEGRNASGSVYPEPDLDALSNYIDELRTEHPSERFNIITIRMTSPTDIVFDRIFDEAFQRESEEMVNE